MIFRGIIKLQLITFVLLGSSLAFATASDDISIQFESGFSIEAEIAKHEGLAEDMSAELSGDKPALSDRNSAFEQNYQVVLIPKANRN